MSYDKNKPSEYDGLFQKAADAHGVSYDLLRKLAFNESTFNPMAKSKTGPKGMMQMTTNTARALGLNAFDPGVDNPADERYNPELAVNAAAKHLAELVGKFDGDELKAALAYNQGEGPKGAPQLEAYSKGDFAAISEEGRGYMRKLMDVAKSPQSGALEAFGGITPKGKGIPSADAFAGIGTKSKVGESTPEVASMSIKGTAQAAPNEPFAKDYWEKTGQTLEEAESRSTFFGFGSAVEAELSTSTLGMAYRAARQDNGFDVFKDNITPTRWNTHTFTAEELEKIRKEVKNPAYINVVTGGSPENLDALIKLANDNFAADSRASEAGMGAKLSAGIIGAGVDPLSYVPLVGVSGKGIKVVNKAFRVGAQAGALNVASEGIRTSLAGGEGHYAEAALSGLLFGAGMSAITDGIAAGLRKSNATSQVVNDWQPTNIRLEARETAINTGGEDLTKFPSDRAVFDGEHVGVQYAKHPTEDGAVVLANGSILSDTNPANPALLKEFSEINPERSAKGIQLGGLTEIGLKTLRSETPEIRAVASDLVRSPVGMESGSHGKFGATASDIKERLHATNQRTYNQLYDAVAEAMRDPQYSVGVFTMNREGIRQDIYKKAALAIERPELQKGLTKSERKVMDIMKQHFDTKRELMENPAVFGNTKATSIFPDSRHKGTYVPNVYDRGTKVLMVQRYGAEGLQEGIAKSWVASYVARPEVKARVDEMLKETLGVEDVTMAMVEKHAMDKAYGISHSDQFTGSSVIDDNLNGLVGIENNSYLEARNLFDSDMSTTMPDGSTFSVNDLRDFDMMRVMPSYDRRIDGDIAIMGGTGKTTKDLKDHIMELDNRSEGKGNMKGEVEALKDVVKLLTGRSRRNQDGAFETTIRGLNDLAFFAKNAYMAPQNITEISGMLAKGNVRAMLHGIPMMRDLAYKGSVVKGSELKELHGVIFGKELDDLIRPGRQDLVQRLREATDTSNAVAQAVGTFKYATQELSARSPWTRLLNGSSNYLMDAARQGLLGDVANAALAGKGSKFGKANFLKSASVSPEQFEGIKALFREHATIRPDGSYSIKDKQKFANDPRAMDLWRLADKVADETMLRPHKISEQDSKAYGAGVKMALQFKNFVIKSLNAKFVRSFYEGYKNNRAIDMALTHILSLGMAGSYYVAQAHVKAAGLQEHQQKDYLKRSLDEKMIAYAALSRSSHIGSPLSIVTMMGGLAGIDEFKMLRSTILPRGLEEKPQREKASKSRDVVSDIMGNVGEQIPALGFLGAVGSTAINTAGVVGANNKPDEREYMTGLMNSMRELVPNDPLTQQLIIKMYESNGVTIKDPKKSR